MAENDFFTIIAGLSGAIAVGLGAYGAHGLDLTTELKDTWKTGSFYHLIHTIALINCTNILNNRKKLICCSFFLLGIILFPGSCYLIGLTKNKRYGKIAPYGGMSFIFGWLSFAFL